MTSLPVPDSPCRNTVVSVGATRSARASARSHASDRPTTRRSAGNEPSRLHQPAYVRLDAVGPRTNARHIGLRPGAVALPGRNSRGVRRSIAPPSRSIAIIAFMCSCLRKCDCQ